MRSSMDYTSPNQDSKLDHDQLQSTNTSTVSATATVAPTHHQTLGAPNVGYPSPDPVSAAAAVTWYRECQKNHAAASGGYVLDGCGEFMPSGADENSPASLKCAACECHRSFHRRETQGGHSRHHMVNESQLNLRGGVGGNNTGSSVLLSHQYLNHHHHHQPRHHQHQQPVMMMAFGGAESSSDDLNSPDQAGRLLLPASSAAKKRFRTKFNQEQKEKMTELAERLGWRIQKHDEQEVQRFCSQVGVKRQVLKVWMHNNKQNMKKKEDERQQQQQ